MGAEAKVLLCILLGLLLTSTPRVLGANPGLVARITNRGLEYAAKEGLWALQRELNTITLPDFSGDFKISHVGRGNYEFYSLEVQDCKLHGSALKPLPGQGLSLSVSDSSIKVSGKWKAKKSFLRFRGSFDLNVKGITISVNLLLGIDPSGRPTVTASECSASIRDVDVDISGNLGWLLNLFHKQIESKFRRVLESEICKMIQASMTSDLQPYLQTLPVTGEIDSVLGIDYSLAKAPLATAQTLDVMFKGEIFNLDLRFPSTSPAPAITLPDDHKQMVYFAISGHAFNIASRIYHQAGYLNFIITDDMLPPDSNIRLNTRAFRPFTPQITRWYPNMNLELQGTVVSAPLLSISSGKLSLTPQMEIKGFVLLPSSGREPIFRLGVVTQMSASLTFNSSKITGFLTSEKAQVELKESKVGMFNVDLFQAFLNYYLVNTLYPDINAKLATGFPLPLPSRVQLRDLDLQIHKDFLYVGANVQYVRV